MIRVLLTGGGGAGNEALWRLLGDRYELHFADADPEAFDPNIPGARCRVVPAGADPGFVDALAALCERLSIDVLVPGVDEELLPLAEATARFHPTQLMLPPQQYVATMLDKLAAMRRLAAAGIPVPHTQPIADPSGITFPCIAKPRRGRGSRDVRIVNDPAACAALATLQGDHPGMLLQDRLVGDEYTVLMAADREGHLAAVVPVKVGIKRGITLRARTNAQASVIAACSAIHRALPASGCYNIQLILTNDGRVLPFEINPRISTTFCLSVAAEVDPIAIFLGTADNVTLSPFVTGIELKRFWRNVFSQPSLSDKGT